MVQSLLKRHERPSGEASGKYLEIMGRHASMQNKKGKTLRALRSAILGRKNKMPKSIRGIKLSSKSKTVHANFRRANARGRMEFSDGHDSCMQRARLHM